MVGEPDIFMESIPHEQRVGLYKLWDDNISLKKMCGWIAYKVSGDMQLRIQIKA